MTTTYDAVVVGARCGGAPTAMLLAQRGYKVLLVDRASFPSDTLSTHYLHQPAVAALARWGLLDEVVASGCPAVQSQTLDFGPIVLRGSAPAVDGHAETYCVRRTVLDEILVRAAAAAGAEVRERFTVDEVSADGTRVTGIRGHAAGSSAAIAVRARVVVGADGRSSLLARTVKAPEYDAHPTLTCAYYTYFSGVASDGAELFPRPGSSVITAPTNDGLTMAIAYRPSAEFARVRADVENSFMQLVSGLPSLADRIAGGERVEPFRGTGTLPNFYRRPFGDGWALVGDAGCHKDPILALGITDAFRDAELLVDALDAGFCGREPLDRALEGYQTARDEQSAQGYQNTLQLAALQPPPDDVQQLFGALVGNREQIDRLYGTFIGTVAAAEFFSPDNVGRIMAGAATPAAVG